MNLPYWCITILVLQTALSGIKTEELYDRSSENNIMEGLEIIGTYFTEFNEILVGYVSQPSPTKHEFKASCRNETVKTFFQKIIRKSSLKVIVRNTTKQLSLCFSEEQDQPVSGGVNEICLQKQTIENHLNNSKAKKVLGDDVGGDIISCSVNVRHRLISTQSATTNTVRASTQSAHQFNDSRNAINSSITSAGWFTGGVALGFLTSALILLLVWIYNSYKQRRKERSKDKKSRKKMPTVYEDIDEYEMIPIYRDCEAHCRLTRPKTADHEASTFNKEQPRETLLDHYFCIEEDKTTEHTSNYHPESNARMSSSGSCEYKSSATQKTFIEQTGTYFVLEKNKDCADNHDTHDHSRDSIENRNNSSSDATTTNICGTPNKYAKDCRNSDGMLNTTSNDMDTRNNNIRDDPNITDANIATGNGNDNLLKDDAMKNANNGDSCNIESNCTDDVLNKETNSMCNEYHILLLSEKVSQKLEDTTAIYM